MIKVENNSILSWLKDERVSIIFTILTPIIGAVVAIIKIICQNEIKTDTIVTILDFLQFGFVVISFYFIMTNRMLILTQLSKREELLKHYFLKECHIRNEAESPLREHFAVVRNTVRQFYFCWMVIWVLWTLYYGMTTIGRWLPNDFIDSFWEFRAQYIFKSLVDFASSIVLFFLYLILNNVTVDRERREEANPHELRFGGIFLLVCISIIGALFIQSLSISDHACAFVFMMIVNLALGIFSAFAFVILLGKLNSFYLQIPILLNLLVYIYAIIQVFSPLTMLADGIGFIKEYLNSSQIHSLKDLISTSKLFNGGIRETLNIFNASFLFVTLIGKLCLTLVLYWIVYNFRFIYFVITKSLSLTETPEKIKVFMKYIGEKGDE